MKIKSLSIIFISFFAVILGCESPSTNSQQEEKPKEEKIKEEKTVEFPSVKKLAEYQKTTFLPTLEHALPAGKNSIYAVSMLYAWDKIRDTLREPLTIEPKYEDLFLLNASKSYQNTLRKDEYTIKTEIKEEATTVFAYFQKNLALTDTLQVFKDSLTFDNVKVKSFGVNRSKYDLYEMFWLPYYQDDNNFILKIRPKDSAHEIILCKFGESKASFAAYLQKIKEWTTLGDTLQKDYQKYWRFEVNRMMDKVIMPKLLFNIETQYDKIIGNEFLVGKKLHHIVEAYQRTAFIFNEQGAKVETEAVPKEEPKKEEAKSAEKPRPKNLVFDKPFLLLMKRTDNENPYFAMWINNAELMEKE